MARIVFEMAEVVPAALSLGYPREPSSRGSTKRCQYLVYKLGDLIHVVYLVLYYMYSYVHLSENTT